MESPYRPAFTLHDLGKCAAHGLAFSAIFFLLSIAWAALLVILVVCGLYLGLAIGIVLLFVFMGYVNAFVSEALWFRVRTGFVPCLGHGFLLFLALLPVNLTVVAVQALVTPDPLVSLLLFVALSPVTGLFAKKVAGLWEVRPSALAPSPTPAAPDEASAPPPVYFPRK